ncbi:MAG: helix-turn-helix domain-containing protein [Elusimicrobia bacterium]|nr:helix-turn-helix domain-containing protein [Elusimicrobiota bacterium]
MKKTLISERIRELRKQKGLTQKQLAQKVNVVPKYIAHIESGFSSPSKKLLEIISKFFNVPLSYFLEEHISIDKGNIIALPIIKKIKPGEPIILKENIKGYISLPKEIAQDGTFVWQVNDDSNIDAGIKKGDSIIVRQQPTIKKDDFALALKPHETEPHIIVPNGTNSKKIQNAFIIQEKSTAYEQKIIILGKIIGRFGGL